MLTSILFTETFFPDGTFYEQKGDPFPVDDQPHPDRDDGTEKGYRHQVHYVYDAAAERTQQRIQEGHALVNGVH